MENCMHEAVSGNVRTDIHVNRCEGLSYRLVAIHDVPNVE